MLRKNSNRSHLARKRRRKGEKTPLQKSFNGYWTKNFLPISKNPHFNWIVKIMGE
jgi:hypothetical protein